MEKTNLSNAPHVSRACFFKSLDTAVKPRYDGHSLVEYILCCFFCCIPFFSLATSYQPMDGSPFPVLDSPSPVKTSQNYTLKLPVTLRVAKGEFPLDTPQGALLAVLSEDEALEAVVEDKTLPVFNYRGLKDPPIKGEVFHLSGLSRGLHKLSLEGFRMSADATIIVSQPKSPLLLKAQAKPLAMTTEQNISVLVELLDEAPIRSAEVFAVFMGHSYRGRQIDPQKFMISLLAPTVKIRESLPIYVLANGTRFDKKPFRREGKIYVMVIRPKSGLKKVSVNPQGEIDVEVLPASGHFRLNVIYGYKGKAIAFAEERFVLTEEDSTTSFSIKRPKFALTSDKALVKLLNMATLGLEGQQVLSLSPDLDALRTFQMPTPIPPALPENKKKALDLLEYTIHD